jgi:hypothetical protein
MIAPLEVNPKLQSETNEAANTKIEIHNGRV